jgi:hypothetical protein
MVQRQMKRRLVKRRMHRLQNGVISSVGLDGFDERLAGRFAAQTSASPPVSPVEKRSENMEREGFNSPLFTLSGMTLAITLNACLSARYVQKCLRPESTERASRDSRGQVKSLKCVSLVSISRGINAGGSCRLWNRGD